MHDSPSRILAENPNWSRNKQLRFVLDWAAQSNQSLNRLSGTRSLTHEEQNNQRQIQNHILPEAIRQLALEQNKERTMSTVRDRCEETPEALAARNGTNDIDGFPRSGLTADKWLDKDGRPIRLLSSTEKLSHVSGSVSRRRNASLGAMICGMITGDWRNREIEKLAMGEGANTAGGYLISDELSSTLIDLARSKSVMIAAGAKTVDMKSDVLQMARVTSDPTIESKSENAAFSGSETTFGMMSMTAMTIGQVIYVSRELVQDAPNAASVIENSLAQALAMKLDSWAMVGTGSAQFTGLLTRPDVAQTTGVAAVAWEDFVNAIVDIETRDFAPNAMILNPVISGDLSTLTTGDGTNAAKNWLPAPANVASLAQLKTTACPLANAFVGQFDQAVFGVRLGAEIRVSESANGAFEKNQIAIRIVHRGDFGLLQPDAFHRLTGISS